MDRALVKVCNFPGKPWLHRSATDLVDRSDRHELAVWGLLELQKFIVFLALDGYRDRY